MLRIEICLNLTTQFPSQKSSLTDYFNYCSTDFKNIIQLDKDIDRLKSQSIYLLIRTMFTNYTWLYHVFTHQER